MKQTLKSNRITNAEFQSILYQELNAGNEVAHRKTGFWRLLKTVLKKQIDKTRSLRLHDVYYPQWAKINTDAVEKVIVKNAENSTRDALTTKQGKIDWYTSEVRRIESQLRGDLHFTFALHTKVFPSHDKEGKFTLPIQVQNELRRTLREYISELSKLGGEYVMKVSETDPNGEEKKKFNVKDMPTDLLLQMAAFITNPQ